MSVEKKLMDDYKIAMKSGDKVRLETIRGMRSQLKNFQIEKMRELTEDEVLQVLNSAAKKRRDAIELYQQHGKADRADEELQELAIIEAYLPKQLDESAIAELVEKAIAETNADSIKDMGKIMGVIMPQVKGVADGKLVQQIVKDKLSAR
ncbi:MAG: GatB/YqeY domain-containing protein [Calditrichaeota bacterium]|nr:GatB/YqeY domain-containing protein [Calditrichota bacterium]MCB0268570.1 GatB/YqeY domain-containing protein [Calditrichota bacterium]MCB0298478.1 GatB/YqeY domain-containing protein [Calditrichota bacterium]